MNFSSPKPPPDFGGRLEGGERLLVLLLLLLLAISVAACANSNAESSSTASSPTVFTFSEDGVYRLPGGAGTLQLGQQPLSIWQTDTPAGPSTFFYAPVTATRHSYTSALFWDPQTAADTATPLPLPPLSTTDVQITAEHLVWQEKDNSYQSEADMELPWLWTRIIAPDQWRDTITVPVGTTAPYTLTVRLWAKTAMPANPDHHVQLLWDDTLVGDETWDGAGIHTLSVPVPDAAPGQHDLTIIVPGDTEALAEVIYVDGWGLAVQRSLDIRQEPATWSATTTAARIQVNPRQPVWLLDITDPLSPLVFGPAIPTAPDLTVATQLDHRYWAATTEQMPLPPAQRPRQTLSATEHQILTAANYIIVGDETFLAAAQPLLDYRQSTGLDVATLTPLQLLDTWGEGVPGVTAWRNFMDWRRAEGQLPDYLLLLGDADSTPWAGDEKALAQRLPTAFVRTVYIGETPSDVALLGEDAGSVAVGRIPARTVAEVEAAVQKTLTYERSAKSRRHLFLNDDDAEFDTFAADIAAIWQQQGDTTEHFATGSPTVRDDVLAALQAGPAWLHYVGHGSPLLWSQSQVLSAADAAAWDDPAIVFAWTCLSGYFILADDRSLAEQWLLAPSGGAVAVIAPTGEDVTANQQPFADAVYRALPESGTLGAALAHTRAHWPQQEIVWQYHLFGDPALTVGP